MRINHINALILTLITTLTIAAGSADPSLRYTNARSIGMGNAFSAIADDYSAVFENPAGMTQISNFEIGLMNTKLFDTYNSLNGAMIIPLKNNSKVGIGAIYSGTDGIYSTTRVNYNGTTFNEYSDSYNFNYLMLLASYAQELDNGLAWGVTGKYATQQAGSLYEASNFNMDLGALYKVNDSIKLAMTYQNILPTNLNISNGGENPVQSKITFGGAYRLMGTESAALVYNKDQLIDIGFDMELEEDNIMPKIGIEYKPNPYLALRAGYAMEKQAINPTQAEYAQNLSLGLGLKFNGIGFDYAYNIDPNSINENNTHYFSMVFNLSPTKIADDIDYLTVIRPEDKTVTYENYQRVSGTVAPGVERVNINGTDVPVIGGKFLAAVKFRDLGKQIIRVKAYDRFGNLLDSQDIRMLYLASFTDVGQKNWAKRYIEELATLGIMPPTNPNYFEPYGEVQRADLASILVRAKQIPISTLDLSKGYQFTDIQNNPLADYIQLAYQENIMIGITKTIFEPHWYTNREQVAVTFLRMDQSNVAAKAQQSRFTDVKANRWSTPFIEKAVDQQMINGYNDGTFRPTRRILRAELAKMLYFTNTVQPQIKDLFDWESYQYIEENVYLDI